MNVVWTDRALDDIEGIYRYVASDKEGAVRRLATRLIECSDQLGAHPYLGRATRTGNVRELVAGKYLVLYRVREMVEILSIVHGARRRRKR